MIKDISEAINFYRVKNIKRRIGISKKRSLVWFLYTYIDIRNLTNKTLLWAPNEIKLRKHLNNNDISEFDYEQGVILLKTLTI